MENITLPTFFCPFPSGMHPQTSLLQDYSSSWVRHFQLVPAGEAMAGFEAMRFSWLTGLVYRRAPVEDLKLVDDWQTWMFLLDDHFDGQVGRDPDAARVLLDELYRVIAGKVPASSSSPFVQALQQLRQRTAPLLTEQWRERVTSHLLRYLDAYQWETRNRSLLVPPAIETYMQERIHSGAMFFAFDQLELINQQALPDDIYASHEIQTLLRTANNVVCWVNDIFSFLKEQASGDMHNLVALLVLFKNITYQEAVHEVNEMIKGQVQVFIATSQHRSALAPPFEQVVQGIIEGLGYWMRAIIDWSLLTQRYGQIEQTTGEQRMHYSV